MKSPYSDVGPERVGFVLKNGDWVEVANVSHNPNEAFKVSGRDILKYLEDAEATWHTHPGGSANLSADDYLAFSNYPQLKHLIIGRDGVRCYAVERGAVVEIAVGGPSWLLEGSPSRTDQDGG